MVLKPKIIKETPLNKEELRDEIISKGGYVAADKEQGSLKKKEWMTFGLRIKTSMLDQIDKVLEERVGISKTGWILEAIQEKLIRTRSAHPSSSQEMIEKY